MARIGGIMFGVDTLPMQIERFDNLTYVNVCRKKVFEI